MHIFLSLSRPLHSGVCLFPLSYYFLSLLNYQLTPSFVVCTQIIAHRTALTYQISFPLACTSSTVQYHSYGDFAVSHSSVDETIIFVIACIGCTLARWFEGRVAVRVTGDFPHFISSSNEAGMQVKMAVSGTIRSHDAFACIIHCSMRASKVCIGSCISFSLVKQRTPNLMTSLVRRHIITAYDIGCAIHRVCFSSNYKCTSYHHIKWHV